MSQKGLGTGLGALISMFDEEAPKSPMMKKSLAQAEIANGVEEIDISLIDNNINQPRKYFDPVQLQELADSIVVNGVFQPILVNKVGARYLIVAGERRWRASKLAGLAKIPAIVRNYSNRQIAEIAIIENLQREDLNDMDLARGIKKLMDDHMLTQEKVATVLGKSRSSIANTLRLLNLPSEVQALVEHGQLSAGHAKCLVAVSDAEKCKQLARDSVSGRLSVRELEDIIQSARETRLTPPSLSRPKPQGADMRRVALDLGQALGTKVTIQGTDRSGRIVIEYYEMRELERLIAKLKG
ncbi:MAG: ParB/RepB/Spo0J family partition protein [Firmicutes bacterium]|nr:ParB/RepB/Spo0J family partition protein [Bacillota bacterium]